MSIPTRALIGAAITAATRVTDLQGQVVAGWGVTLQKMQKGTTTWKPVKSLITTSTGGASYRFTNGVSGSYRWVTSPATGAPSKVSRSVALTSTARVSGTRTATTSAPSRYVAVNGSVSSVPAPVVYVQYRYPGGTWRTGPRAAVTGRKVTGRIVFKVATTAYTRLYVRPGAAYIGSFSSPYTTVVR